MAEESGDGADPRDGRIDFAHYSDIQLQELHDSIDRARFPKNFQNLEAELARRSNRPASARPYAVRLTPANGLAGWLQAAFNNLPLYGAGTIDVRGANLILSGWRRTWLGAPAAAQIAVPLNDIRNVRQQGARLDFERKRRWRTSQFLSLALNSPAEALELSSLLPKTTHRTSLDLRDYHDRLRDFGAYAWITPAAIVINIVIFAVMAVMANSITGFDLSRLLGWGALYEPLLLEGQWWRLLSYQFLHITIVHLALNMWVLWSVGRLCERLYGSVVFASLLLLSGVLGGFASVIWNPAQVSAGASGAIFGVLGAFLALLLHRQSRFPTSVIRSHWLPTSLFVLFNLALGIFQPGVDNASHVGGFLGGAILGWLAARPLHSVGANYLPVKQLLLTTAVTATIAVAALWYLGALTDQLSVVSRYNRSHRWYFEQAGPNLLLWQELANRAGTGAISADDLSARFSHEIRPFWAEARRRLQAELPTLKGDEHAFGLLVLDVAKTRIQWATTVIEATASNDPARVRAMFGAMQRADRAQARLDRVLIRDRMAHGARPLAESAIGVWVRTVIAGSHGHCVQQPIAYGPLVADTDDKKDGPAARHASGCNAQRLFMAGDYAALDGLMDSAAKHMNDLPDGSSTLEGIWGGLGDLFAFGGLSFEDAMHRTADWRQARPNSVHAELVEVLVLGEWARAARGSGYASTVSAQALEIFHYRSEMAAAGLREVASRAAADPAWYQLSLRIGRDQSVPLDRLRALFDRGEARFHTYWPLHRSMLNTLMPRWYGSFEAVDDFIVTLAKKAGKATAPDTALYARLYMTYAQLEGEDMDAVLNAKADRDVLRAGLANMRKRYPHSDYVLNLAARFACTDDVPSDYLALRPLLRGHESATAWQNEMSIKACDERTGYSG